MCDFKGHNVVVFNEEGMYLRRIGCETLTNYPNGIDISDAGDVLIGDSHGNRFHVAVFSRDGSLISEFECPYVKVSARARKRRQRRRGGALNVSKLAGFVERQHWNVLFLFCRCRVVAA